MKCTICGKEKEEWKREIKRYSIHCYNEILSEEVCNECRKEFNGLVDKAIVGLKQNVKKLAKKKKGGEKE